MIFRYLMPFLLLHSAETFAGTFELSGKTLECKRVKRILVDNKMKQSGSNYGGTIRLNYRSLMKKAKEVQWFVFYHECGHSYVGGELGADAYAAKLGRKEGWLTDKAVEDVCKSFKRRADDDHPSRATRCNAIKNLIHYFDKELKTKAPEPKHTESLEDQEPSADITPPQ